MSGKASSTHTHNNMTAATASAAGKAGFVPAPAKGAQAKFLRGDATWQTISTTDTKNTAGTTNKTGTKMFLAGATSQAANPVTYSNSNCYIGTDNCLYSGGKKTSVEGHTHDNLNKFIQFKFSDTDTLKTIQEKYGNQNETIYVSQLSWTDKYAFGNMTTIVIACNWILLAISSEGIGYFATGLTSGDEWLTHISSSMISDLQSNFQAGVNTCYNACVDRGVTPASSTPSAIYDAVGTIYTNRYNDAKKLDRDLMVYTAGTTTAKAAMSINLDGINTISWNGGYVNHSILYVEVRDHCGSGDEVACYRSATGINGSFNVSDLSGWKSIRLTGVLNASGYATSLLCFHFS